MSKTNNNIAKYLLLIGCTVASIHAENNKADKDIVVKVKGTVSEDLDKKIQKVLKDGVKFDKSSKQLTIKKDQVTAGFKKAGKKVDGEFKASEWDDIIKACLKKAGVSLIVGNLVKSDGEYKNEKFKLDDLNKGDMLVSEIKVAGINWWLWGTVMVLSVAAVGGVVAYFVMQSGEEAPEAKPAAVEATTEGQEEVEDEE